MNAILIGKDGTVQHYNVPADRHIRETIMLPSIAKGYNGAGLTFRNDPRRFEFVGTTPNRLHIYEER